MRGFTLSTTAVLAAVAVGVALATSSVRGERDSGPADLDDRGRGLTSVGTAALEPGLADLARTGALAPSDGARVPFTVEREAELLGRIESLERSLAREQDQRRQREAEWLEFTRAIASLSVESTPEVPEFLAEELALDDAVETALSEAAAREQEKAEVQLARARQLVFDLRALLVAEQFLAFDPLELGRVHDGWTGPVVVRLLDDRARPSGLLAAERLRVEASRAGRSVTIILEEGYESHGGIAVPFGTPTTPGSDRGGIRRIHLVGVDPEPWIEVLPELVNESALVTPPNDGLWNLNEVRLAIDELLRRDTTGGHWRLRAVGGVVSGELQDVQLIELDDDARFMRRLFADRMRVRRHGSGVEILLQDGVQERHGRMAPFLDGSYRLYLPRVDVEEWAAAGVPGLMRVEQAEGDDR